MKISRDSNVFTLKIRVEPRSSRTVIAGQYGDAIKVKLKAPPVEGQANKALIIFLAGELKTARKNVEIVSGQNSKNKIVKITGVDNIDVLTRECG
ncbi:MAG: YggU family protein [Nitrospira sp.]|nr:YggU family protein [Nitrospira sp.]